MYGLKVENWLKFILLEFYLTFSGSKQIEKSKVKLVVPEDDMTEEFLAISQANNLGKLQRSISQNRPGHYKPHRRSIRNGL